MPERASPPSRGGFTIPGAMSPVPPNCLVVVNLIRLKRPVVPTAWRELPGEPMPPAPSPVSRTAHFSVTLAESRARSARVTETLPVRVNLMALPPDSARSGGVLPGRRPRHPGIRPARSRSVPGACGSRTLPGGRRRPPEVCLQAESQCVRGATFRLRSWRSPGSH